jgi:putative protease
MKKVLQFAEFASKLGIDAFIVQDIGLGFLLKNLGIPLHASTQMTIHSISGAEIVKEMGFSRVVLARELSKSQIQEICKTGIEVEIFVHGALCMSVSGQCFFSAFMGKRSANRGVCGSVCRLPFGNILHKNTHSLSLKDLCLIKHLSQIEEIGVTSVKIEGRMKNAEYIKETVSAYRRAIDKKGYILKNIFRNVEFTDGYFTGIVKNMFGIRK